MKIKLVPVGVMFTFDFKGENKERVRFHRKLYGYKDISHNGEYTYDRFGLLSKIPYLKPSESTIIVRKEDSREVRDFLKENGADFSENIVILNEEEAKKFRLIHPYKWQDLVEDLKGSEDLLLTMDF